MATKSSEYISKNDALSYLPQYPLDYSYEETQAFMKGFTQLRDCIRRCTAADVVPASVFRDCRNELCLKCGAYTQKHLGACDGCRWREMNG